MQRQSQNHIPFLSNTPIFAVVFKHLTPAAMGALAQTCFIANAKTNLCKDNMTRLLFLIGKLDRKQAARFFHQYRAMLGVKVTQLLQNNPDNPEAFTLYAMISMVNTNMIDVAKLQITIQYLKQQQYPERIIQSLEFIAAILTLPKGVNDIKHLFPAGSQFYLNMRGVKLDGKDMSECDLTGANLENACLTEVNADESDFSYANLNDSVITFSSFDGAIFIGAHISHIQEDLGFPHEPVFDHARFFQDRRQQTVNATLAFYHHEHDISEYLLNAITKDFADVGDNERPGAELAVLEQGLQDPLFATHSDLFIGFINRHVFSIFTRQQQIIADQIKAVQLVQELEAPEPVNKKAK